MLTGILWIHSAINFSIHAVQTCYCAFPNVSNPPVNTQRPQTLTHVVVLFINNPPLPALTYTPLVTK